jgi:hypothetical protein
MPNQKPGNEGSTLGRLADRGEEAVTKLIDELAKNPRVTDALARVMEMKGKADEASRKAIANSSTAAAGQIKDLRHRLEKLEQRLQTMEADSATEAPAKKPAASATATKPTAKAATKPVAKSVAKPAVKKAAKPAARKPPAKPKPPAA